MIDLKRLGYFVRIAEDGSLSKAARTLHIAQPALSRQIRILEDYLGFQLFTRTSRGMQLTREGEYLRSGVVGPLRDLELAVQNMRSFMSRVDWHIGLGLHPGLIPTLSGPLVRMLREQFPDIRFRIVEGPTSSQVDWLKRGVIDFALVDFSIADGQLSDRLLTNEPLMLVGPGEADKADDPAAFEEAARLPLVLPCRHHGLRRAADEAATRARVSLNIRFEADSLPLITAMLAAENLYTLLPASLVNHCLPLRGITARQVTGPALTSEVYLGSRSYGDIEGSHISKIDRTLQEMVIDLLAPASQ